MPIYATFNRRSDGLSHFPDILTLKVKHEISTETQRIPPTSHEP